MGAKHVLDKDARKLAKKMESEGFRFEEGRKHHISIVAPNGDHVGTISASPGTPRWELAALRTLCRRWKVQL